MINKFEAIGIGISIALMAVALFFIRVDSTFLANSVEETGSNNQTASIVVAEGEDDREALGNALAEAVGDSGQIEKIIVDDVVLGAGEAVKDGDKVTVHYVGTLQNGQQFDNSYSKGSPFSFVVGEGKVITGWDQGIVGMKVGGQRVLVIPSDLAYGDAGFGPIPGKSTLVFAIELLSINR